MDHIVANAIRNPLVDGLCLYATSFMLFNILEGLNYIQITIIMTRNI